MIFKPHRVRHVPALQYQAAGGDLGQLTYPATEGEYMGQVDRLTTAAAFDQYNVEAKVPAQVFLEVRDAKRVELSDYIVFDGKVWDVKTAPAIVEHGLPGDHGHFLMEFVKNAPTV